MQNSGQRNQGKPVPGDDYVQALARGLAVIRSFGADTPQQTLTEVAKRVGLSRAGARRLLLTLVHLGYVTKEDRRFRLAAHVLDLGFTYLNSLPFSEVAGPIVKALVDEIQESSSITILDGDHVVYVSRVQTRKIMSVNIAIGTRLPAFWTSTGRMLLSSLPNETLLERLRALHYEQFTKFTKNTLKDIYESILQAREQGWCIVDQELEEGLISIAVPILDKGGNIISAINASSNSYKYPPTVIKLKILPHLLHAADRISRMMRTKET